MQRFNYPTTIFYGEGAVQSMAAAIAEQGLKSVLLVTDKTLVQLGVADRIQAVLDGAGLKVITFDETHPNPIEDDAIRGASLYVNNSCDCVVALGGGSPMDAAKGIMLLATQPPPLAQYDDALGGDRHVKNPLPPLFAIPTTAGTGSEVGRAGVIIIKETNNKTILFHPKLLPTIAALEPSLTAGLPPFLTAATGLDALTHCLEAFLAPGFHPMADGIAFEGMRLIVRALPRCVQDGSDLKARGEMQVAASMGATAFQKGLGMIHAIAHPLSSECGLHHGLANALLLAPTIRFFERAPLTSEQKERLERVQSVFAEVGLAKSSLSQTLESFVNSLGIESGLSRHGVSEELLESVARKGIDDVSHKTNMFPVTQQDLLTVLREAF